MKAWSTQFDVDPERARIEVRDSAKGSNARHRKDPTSEPEYKERSHDPEVIASGDWTVESERMDRYEEFLRSTHFASTVIRSMASKVDVVQFGIAEVGGYRKVGKASQGDREVTDLDLPRPDSVNKGN